MRYAAALLRGYGAALLGLALVWADSAAAMTRPRDGTEEVREIIAALAAEGGRDRASARSQEERVRAIYRMHFDGDGIAAAILGRALPPPSDAARRDLSNLLEDYLVKIVAARVPDFAGAQIVALLSEPDGDGVVVLSHVAADRRQIDLRWRLLKSGDGFRVRDVIVNGVSLVLAQRREIAAAAAGHGGGPDGLLRALRERLARLGRDG